MTRFELLRLLLAHARTNGFEFRRWYTSQLQLPWQSTRHAIEVLAAERRYYALLFSHDFACHFWKAGAKITFIVPAQSFKRSHPDGRVTEVSRRSYVRRSGRIDTWRYHLRELALVEEPLRYMRRYIRVEDELEEDG